MTTNQIQSIIPLIMRADSSVALGETDPGVAAKQIESIVRSHGIRPGELMLWMTRKLAVSGGLKGIDYDPTSF